jgi:hypothetical protein
VRRALPDRKPARVEGAAERERDLAVAVPAEVEHRALGREELERPLQSGRRGARVHDEVAITGGVVGQREADAERRGDLRAGRIDVDQRDLRPGEPREQARDRATDHAGADDGDAVADQRRCVPERVHGGLDRARQHRPCRRHVVRDDRDRAGRDDVRGLVRVEAEHRAAAQLGRALLDGADAEVAVLHRPWEVALLERRPHHGVLAGRHAAAEHERLGAAADAGAQRPHHDVAHARLRQRRRADLADTRCAHPERPRVVERRRHRAGPRGATWTGRSSADEMRARHLGGIRCTVVARARRPLRRRKPPRTQGRRRVCETGGAMPVAAQPIEPTQRRQPVPSSAALPDVADAMPGGPCR